MSSATIAPKRAAYFPAFDGLRAVAALLVVVVHTSAASGYTFRSRLGDFTARGEIGVSVFFLISGFLLYRPFCAAALEPRASPATGSYLVRRALRILPLYWVALAVTYAFTGRESVHGWRGLLQNAFLLQIYSRDWIFHGITQAWSLCIEVTFYLALPIWAVLLGRKAASRTPQQQLRRELLGLAALYVASFAFRWWVDVAPTGPTQTGRSWLPAWGDHFALGMALAVVSAYYARVGRAPDWLNRRGADIACWVAAAVTFWVVSTRVGMRRDPLFVGSTRTELAHQCLYGLFALFLLLPAVFGLARQGLVRRLLTSRVLTSVGLVSYGIYLWHQLVVRELMDGFHWAVLNAPVVPLLAATLVVVVTVSAVSYLLVERPAIGLGHRWVRRWRERQALGEPLQPVPTRSDTADVRMAGGS